MSDLSKKQMRGAAIGIPLAILLFILGLWRYYCQAPAAAIKIYPGYIEGQFLKIAAPLADQLTHLFVEKGQSVKAGSALFQLEHGYEKAQYQEARARYQQARANYFNLQQGKRPAEIAVIQENMQQAEADFSFLSKQFKRQTTLFHQGVISKENFDKSQSNYRRQAAFIKEIKAQLKVAQLPARRDEIRAAKQAVHIAAAILKQAKWRIQQKRQQAPVAGKIVDIYSYQGDYVGAALPVILFLPHDALKARFFVNGETLLLLKTGMTIYIRFSPHHPLLPATIRYISPTAEYTPPVVYTVEQQSQLVYMIEASPSSSLSLQPGQPVDIHIPLQPSLPPL